MNALAHLDLRDNLMGKIPFGPISHVKTLKTLDLSQNRIEKVHDPFFTLETLRLDQLYLQIIDLKEFYILRRILENLEELDCYYTYQRVVMPRIMPMRQL